VSYIFPAVKGRIGSTEYFQANVSARDLAGVAKLASELQDWTEWSIFERFQRELAGNRVSKEIVPYLAHSKDRFFGALIVLVYKPSQFVFEPVEQFKAKVGKAYQDAAGRMGFLTIDGGDLVVLDGQHRLASLRAVVNAGDTIEGPYRDDVPKDELCVIFIEHESFEKTRRIFNKVNRYAKPTSPSDNIITSEDDGYAIVTRWLVEKHPPLGLSQPLPPLSVTDRSGEPLVEWRTTRLDQASNKLTTLNTIYNSVQEILAAEGIKKFGERDMIVRPSDKKLRNAYTHSANWWNLLLTQFNPFAEAVKTPWSIADRRSYRNRDSLAFRPVAQDAIFQGLRDVVGRSMDISEAVDRLNVINWRASDPLWVDTIIYANGRMATKKEAVRLAGRLIAYQVAPTRFSGSELRQLETALQESKADYDFRLPRAR
jgi:DNA sulfur modification protein DndB